MVLELRSDVKHIVESIDRLERTMGNARVEWDTKERAITERISALEKESTLHAGMTAGISKTAAILSAVIAFAISIAGVLVLLVVNHVL